MPAIDQFANQSVGVSSPCSHAEAVTPHDTNQLVNMSRALYIGTSGDLTVVMADGVTMQFIAVPIGVLPIRVKQVKATGTDAADIVALS